MVGDDVVLPCDVVGSPRPAVRWRRNQVDVDPAHHKYLIDEDSGSLVIHDVDAGDSARYVCVAENVAGVISQHTSLTVYGQAAQCRPTVVRRRIACLSLHISVLCIALIHISLSCLT